MADRKESISVTPRERRRGQEKNKRVEALKSEIRQGKQKIGSIIERMQGQSRLARGFGKNLFEKGLDPENPKKSSQLRSIEFHMRGLERLINRAVDQVQGLLALDYSDEEADRLKSAEAKEIAKMIPLARQASESLEKAKEEAKRNFQRAHYVPKAKPVQKKRRLPKLLRFLEKKSDTDKAFEKDPEGTFKNMIAQARQNEDEIKKILQALNFLPESQHLSYLDQHLNAFQTSIPKQYVKRFKDYLIRQRQMLAPPKELFSQGEDVQSFIHEKKKYKQLKDDERVLLSQSGITRERAVEITDLRTEMIDSLDEQRDQLRQAELDTNREIDSLEASLAAAQNEGSARVTNFRQKLIAAQSKKQKIIGHQKYLEIEKLLIDAKVEKLIEEQMKAVLKTIFEGERVKSLLKGPDKQHLETMLQRLKEEDLAQTGAIELRQDTAQLIKLYNRAVSAKSTYDAALLRSSRRDITELLEYHGISTEAEFSQDQKSSYLEDPSKLRRELSRKVDSLLQENGLTEDQLPPRLTAIHNRFDRLLKNIASDHPWSERERSLEQLFTLYAEFEESISSGIGPLETNAENYAANPEQLRNDVLNLMNRIARENPAALKGGEEFKGTILDLRGEYAELRDKLLVRVSRFQDLDEDDRAAKLRTPFLKDLEDDLKHFEEELKLHEQDIYIRNPQRMKRDIEERMKELFREKLGTRIVAYLPQEIQDLQTKIEAKVDHFTGLSQQQRKELALNGGLQEIQQLLSNLDAAIETAKSGTSPAKEAPKTTVPEAVHLLTDEERDNAQDQLMDEAADFFGTLEQTDEIKAKRKQVVELIHQIDDKKTLAELQAHEAKLRQFLQEIAKEAKEAKGKAPKIETKEPANKQLHQAFHEFTETINTLAGFFNPSIAEQQQAFDRFSEKVKELEQKATITAAELEELWRLGADFVFLCSKEASEESSNEATGALQDFHAKLDAAKDAKAKSPGTAKAAKMATTKKTTAAKPAKAPEPKEPPKSKLEEMKTKLFDSLKKLRKSTKHDPENSALKKRLEAANELSKNLNTPDDADQLQSLLDDAYQRKRQNETFRRDVLKPFAQAVAARNLYSADIVPIKQALRDMDDAARNLQRAEVFSQENVQAFLDAANGLIEQYEQTGYGKTEEDMKDFRAALESSSKALRTILEGSSHITVKANPKAARENGKPDQNKTPSSGKTKDPAEKREKVNPEVTKQWEALKKIIGQKGDDRQKQALITPDAGRKIDIILKKRLSENDKKTLFLKIMRIVASMKAFAPSLNPDKVQPEIMKQLEKMAGSLGAKDTLEDAIERSSAQKAAAEKSNEKKKEAEKNPDLRKQWEQFKDLIAQEGNNRQTTKLSKSENTIEELLNQNLTDQQKKAFFVDLISIVVPIRKDKPAYDPTDKNVGPKLDQQLKGFTRLLKINIDEYLKAPQTREQPVSSQIPDKIDKEKGSKETSSEKESKLEGAMAKLWLHLTANASPSQGKKLAGLITAEELLKGASPDEYLNKLKRIALDDEKIPEAELDRKLDTEASQNKVVKKSKTLIEQIEEILTS